MTEIADAQNTDPPPAETPPNLTYVPQPLRQRVLSLVHSIPSSGHPAITATLQLLNNRFWWPSIQTDTITFIKNCDICNISKSPHQLPAGLLQPLPIPQRPWSHIAIDFVTDLPASQGQTTILTVIDRFSKACRLIPLPKLPTAFETAETLCNYVFRFYGLPEDVVSDRGPQFTSRAWKSFCQELNFNVSLTSGYHPQSNGQVERLNQELTRFLRSYCHRNQSDWSRFLFWAEYAQNSLHKPATGIPPFQCTLGFQPPLFPWSGEPSELPAVNSWLQRSEATWNEAHTHLQRAVRRSSDQANHHWLINPDYQPGQWVWLSTRDLCLRLPCKKLSPRYVCPFKILRQITPVSFRLALPWYYRISPTFHVSLLKPAGGPRGDPGGGWWPEGPSPHCRWRGGVSSLWDSGLLSPGQDTAVSGGLGGVRPRGTVMGQRGGHLGSIPYRRLPSRPSGKASPETSWKTPASVASSRQEPLTGGALSRTQPLWLPPITTRGNPHLSINSHTDISHIPRTWDWLPAQVSLIDSGLFKLLSQ